MKRGLAAVVLVPLLYALLGFYLLPWAGLKLANQKLAEYATVPASLESIELNPFSLELTLHNLRLGEPGAEQLAFARLYANLQVDSLWQGALHLRELQLEQGVASLASDYRLDLAEGLRLQLDNRQLQLNSLQLHEADGRPLLGLDQLHVAAERLELTWPA